MHISDFPDIITLIYSPPNPGGKARLLDLVLQKASVSELMKKPERRYSGFFLLQNTNGLGRLIEGGLFLIPLRSIGFWEGNYKVGFCLVGLFVICLSVSCLNLRVSTMEDG